MRNATISSGSKLGDGLKQAALSAVASIRFLARCVSCYMQLQHEYNELARLSDRGLRDIGLTPFDAQVILRRPIWRRCWQSVRSCPNKRCRNGSICMADCRLTKRQFASTQSDIAIK
jgi:uncharacterized protein YjiS (DUF1127 family)